MSSNTARWRINIKNLQTHISVGIHAHEQVPQRVFINAVMKETIPAKPQNINECFNYDHVHNLIVKEWAKRPHMDLLETWVGELLEFIFRCDDRVDFARASVCKPDIFPDADSVGVEAEWTRADFEQLVLSKKL